MTVDAEREPGTEKGQGDEPLLLRLAVKTKEAAAILGVSVDFFDRHIAPELWSVRRGRVRLYAIRELQDWLDRSAEPARDAPRRGPSGPL